MQPCSKSTCLILRPVTSEMRVPVSRQVSFDQKMRILKAGQHARSLLFGQEALFTYVPGSKELVGLPA